jgi:hypothetical protein
MEKKCMVAKKIEQKEVEEEEQWEDVVDNNDQSILTSGKPKNFQTMLVAFEKNHAKIINKALFIISDGDEHIIFTKGDLTTSYEHLSYAVKGKEKPKRFIHDWLKYEKMKTYNNLGVYPNPDHCPPKHFNLWKPFKMSTVENYDHKEEELQFLLNHIKILCGHQQNIYEYFCSWIGQFLKFPELKSGICITIISQEGGGKGALMRLLSNVMGKKKLYETTSPSRDVWGNFNSVMSSAFLVNLNEISKRESFQAEGQIKGLITDPIVTINTKNKDTYEIESFHRFIITTNMEDPVTSKKDDRRNLIIRASDEKIGDKDYFATLFKLLDDVNVLKTFYEHMINLSDLEKFHKLPKPITEYQDEIQNNNVDIIDRFVISIVENNINRDKVNFSNKTLFAMFKDFLVDASVEYKLNKFQFDNKLSLLVKNLVNVEKTRLKLTINDELTEPLIANQHTRNGQMKHFDIKKLCEYYKIESDLPIIRETKNTYGSGVNIIRYMEDDGEN